MIDIRPMDALEAGGCPQGEAKGRCGWLKDKFEVSWQIVPSVLGEMLQDKDAERVRRVTEAFLKMDKLDIRALKQTYGQR